MFSKLESRRSISYFSYFSYFWGRDGKYSNRISSTATAATTTTTTTTTTKKAKPTPTDEWGNIQRVSFLPEFIASRFFPQIQRQEKQ